MKTSNTKKLTKTIIFIILITFAIHRLSCMVIEKTLGYKYYDPKWSFDGNEILFAKEVTTGGDPGGAQYRTDLFTMSSAGKRIKRIAKGVEFGNFCPTENKIAYIKKEWDKYVLVTVKASGFNKKVVCRFRECPNKINWSPKGDRILAVFDEYSYLVSINEDRLCWLSICDGEWSPDGTMIASRKMIINSNGKAMVNIGQYDVKVYDWSKDSKCLIYDDNSSKIIYIAEVENGEKRQLFKYQNEISSISVSPDNKNIVFIEIEKKKVVEEITTFGGEKLSPVAEKVVSRYYIVSIKGNNLNKFDEHEGKAKQILWSRDGQEIRLDSERVYSIANKTIVAKKWPFKTSGYVELSPDGSKYVYQGYISNDNNLTHTGIFMSDSDGNNRRMIIHN